MTTLGMSMNTGNKSTPMIAVECGNRRAEMDGHHVVFLRITGNVRRSKQPVWFIPCTSERRAKRLASEWVDKAKLPH